MTVAQAAHRSTGRSDLIWKAWPFLAWGLPVLLVVRVFAGGGWEALILAFLSPVLVPGLGLLGMLPRLLLRRKGARRTPGVLTWLLVVHWWCWLAFIVAFPSTGDSGPLPSILGSLARAPLARGFEQGFFLVAGLCAVLTWVAVLVIAAGRPAGADAPGAPAPQGGWLIAAGVSAIAVPLVLVLAVVAGVAGTAAQRDAAGESAVEVQNRPAAEQAARAEARYAEAQALLIPLREALAPAEWEAQQNGFTPYNVCSNSGAECYDFDLAFTVERVSAGASLDRLVEVARAEGWEVEEGNFGFSAENAEGYTLQALMPTAGGASLDLDTPDWFGDWSQISAALTSEGDGSSTLYDFDDWPPLG